MSFPHDDIQSRIEHEVNRSAEWARGFGNGAGDPAAALVAVAGELGGIREALTIIAEELVTARVEREAEAERQHLRRDRERS